MPTELLNLNKDYLSMKEAAAYACVSLSQFRTHCPVPAITFLGKRLYRRADLQAAIEAAAKWQQSISEEPPGTSAGRCPSRVNKSAAPSAPLPEERIVIAERIALALEKHTELFERIAMALDRANLIAEYFLNDYQQSRGGTHDRE